MNTPSPAAQLDALRRQLQRLHSAILEAEKPFHPAKSGMEWLKTLTQDPSWSWLRALSVLIAEIDHVASHRDGASASEAAVAAAHVRSLIAGDGELQAGDFFNHYRALLQRDSDLASVHGEIKGWLKALPSESENESERLHARHQWAVKCRLQPR